MKYRISGVCLATLLAVSLLAHAQTFEQAEAAYKRGDYTNAFQEVDKFAKQGNANAQSLLGSMYALGRGVPKDEQQGLVWRRKAATQGDARSQEYLGLSYALRTANISERAVFQSLTGYSKKTVYLQH